MRSAHPEIARRKTAAHIDHAQDDALIGKRAEDRCRVSQRTIPSREIRLLRADVERHAVSIEAERLGAAQHVLRHGRHATKLTRKRPFGTFAIGQDAAEHAAAGRNAGNLFHFFHAIDRIKADAQIEGARNIALFLDGVAIRDTVWCRACFQRHFDFSNRGRVERRAERSEQAQDFRRGIGLHRIENARIRQSFSKP